MWRCITLAAVALIALASMAQGHEATRLRLLDRDDEWCVRRRRHGALESLFWGRAADDLHARARAACGTDTDPTIDFLHD